MPDSRNATVPSIAAAGDGVSVGRRFTEPGVSPFDAIEWEIRDAIIGDPEKPAFEQRGVEFPKSWSQNATNIVAQKYFRGQLGSPERESSVKQMVGRVAGTIAGWGRELGYFASRFDVSSNCRQISFGQRSPNFSKNSFWLASGDLFRVEDGVERWNIERPHDQVGSFLSSMRRSVIFFRNVFRLMPRICAARI